MSQPVTEESFFFFLLVFWILAYALAKIYDFEKHGLKILPGFMMYRSKSLKGLLDSASRRWRRLWKILSNVGVILAFGLMAFGTYFLADGILKLTYAPQEANLVFVTVPGLNIRLFWLPYFFVALAIIAITHELAHGIAALSEGIPVKSAGLFFAFVFFGGFVEPDKEGFEKSSTISKVRTVCAGCSVNLVTTFLVILLTTSLFASAGGVLIIEPIENGPVDRAGLQRWDVIYAINGSRMLTAQDFLNYMAKVALDQTLILETSKGNKTIVHACIDGDKLVQSILEKAFKRRANEYRVLINVAFFGLLAANLILSFIKYGLVSI